MNNSNVSMYFLVNIKDVKQIAYRKEGKWLFDEKCNSINEMLRDGLIDPDTAQGWANQQMNILNNISSKSKTVH